MDIRETIHQGWLECWIDAGNSKTWMKLSVKKGWKRKYFVLYRHSEVTDQVYLAFYDKDENWHSVTAKKILELFPRYRIAKLQNFKGKEIVLEVNNDQEQWYLFSEKSKILDLWATQVQMQTKLSRSISGRIFSVSGAVSKQMQRIGAAQQRCLLHFTRWGITLALQESRAILSMWPLKTIRNYESSSQCQFSIEAGRRAPMGQGLFVFNTNIGQDEEMFRVLDAFITATLSEKAELSPNNKQVSTDDEILQTYDQLHRCAIGISKDTTAGKDAIDTPGYAPLGGQTRTLQQDTISIYKPPDYNHLYGDAASKQNADGYDHSPDGGFFKGSETPRGLSFTDSISSYDQLDRKESWGNRSTGEYDHIHQKRESVKARNQNAYDRIDRNFAATNSIPQPRSPGFSGYPLRDEPSVPFLDANNEKPFQGRSPLSKTPDSEKFAFRNSIYSPAKDEMYTAMEGGIVDEATAANYATPPDNISTPNDLIELSSRHNSTTSESEPSNFIRSKQRSSSSMKDRSIHDIADHFLYQLPPSLPSNGFVTSESIKEDKDVMPAQTNAPAVDSASDGVQSTESDASDIYQNAESAINSEETSEMYQNSETARDSIFAGSK